MLAFVHRSDRYFLKVCPYILKDAFRRCSARQPTKDEKLKIVREINVRNEKTMPS